jgi:hypothetical protein
MGTFMELLSFLVWADTIARLFRNSLGLPKYKLKGYVIIVANKYKEDD